MVSDIEKAYVAGILDGEGSISIQRQVTKAKGTWLQPMLTITNINEELLEYIKWMYGGGTVVQSKYHRLVIGNPRAIKRLLTDVSPYLIVKKELAKVMLLYCESRLRHPRTHYTAGEMRLYRALKVLNT